MNTLMKMYSLQSLELSLTNNKVVKNLDREFSIKLSYLFEEEMSLDGTISEEALFKVDEEIEWYLYQHNIWVTGSGETHFL